VFGASYAYQSHVRRTREPSTPSRARARRQRHVVAERERGRVLGHRTRAHTQPGSEPESGARLEMRPRRHEFTAHAHYHVLSAH
jgi:hypothetical protein